MTPLLETMRAWSRVSDHVVSSMVHANRATVAAMRPVEWIDGDVRDVESIDHHRSDWRFERSVADVDAIEVGDRITFTKPVTDADVREFADASGDTNRLHLDEGFARSTRFGGRIAHGTLVGGLISAALARLPGLTIYLSQDLEFVSPVEIGDELTATAEVVEALGDGRYRLETRVERGDELVVDGEAVVLIDATPGTEAS